MSGRFPAGAWDGHAHVIGPRHLYPLADGHDYDPAEASLEAYLELLDDLGVARGVLVQPSVYGFDNRCLLDALDRAEGRLVGVVVPRPGTTSRELEAMHRRGVRGVRLNLLNSGGLAPADVLPWRRVLRELGWHVELHADLSASGRRAARPATSGELDLEILLEHLGIPVIVDHMGRPAPGRADPADPGLRRLVELVRQGGCFVKLSAPYRLSDAGPPWADVTPLAQALLAARPSHCLWATDWPHVHTPAVVRPDDLVDALDAWCPEPEDRKVVTVDAPEGLFTPARPPAASGTSPAP